MRPQFTLAAAAVFALTLGACQRTESGDVVVKRPNVDVSSTTDTLHLPHLTSRIDTVSTPVMGTQKETLIVNRPVVGTKKTEVRVPVVQRP